MLLVRMTIHEINEMVSKCEGVEIEIKIAVERRKAMEKDFPERVKTVFF